MKKIIAIILFNSIFAVIIKVEPYLQDAYPNSITIMWETDLNDQSIVHYGTDENLVNMAIGTAQISSGLAQIHTVNIYDLNSDTRYYYKISTNGVETEIYNFITPPATHEHFSFVAMSDMQQDAANPNKFHEVVHDGIIDFLNDNYSGDLADDLGFIMIPGDLVANGLTYWEWENTFFDPASPLFSQVPVYPVLGNHENDSEYYRKYFHSLIQPL